MAKQSRKKPNGLARPIRTKRDYEGASAIAKRLSDQKRRDSAAEQRLRSLLNELEKYDDTDDDMGADLPADDDYAGPRRRWSDDGSGES